MPTFASVNGHGGHFDRSVAVVYDLRACCRGDSAIGANGDRKDRGNGHGHGGGCGITAQGAVLGGTQGDIGTGGAAGGFAGIGGVGNAE